MNAADIIANVQTDFAARLQSLDYFGDIYVAAPRLWKEGERLHTPKSVQDKVDQALTGLITTGGKIGAAVRVFQPTLAMKKTNGREALLLMVCRCEVHPILNLGAQGTNKNVSHIGYNVLRAGQGFTLMQGFCTLFADGECFLPYVSEDRKFATVDILLQANFVVSPLDSVVTPQLIQGANGLITLTNITAGAAIYYSLGPTATGVSPTPWKPLVFPAPKVPGALQYATPFTVDNGTQIRWAAYLPGLAGSNVGFQTITF
jgi:hypothetical protein